MSLRSVQTNGTDFKLRHSISNTSTSAAFETLQINRFFGYFDHDYLAPLSDALANWIFRRNILRASFFRPSWIFLDVDNGISLEISASESEEMAALGEIMELSLDVNEKPGF